MEKPDFKVRHFQAEQVLRKMGQDLKHYTPEGFGFMVLLFTYGDGGAMFYASSAERADMIKAMKEFISKNEK